MATNECVVSNNMKEPAVYIPIATLSVLFGGWAILLTVYLDLHKKMLYRLVLYQVLVGVLYAIFWFCRLLPIDSNTLKTIVVESLLLFAAGSKLMFGVCLTVQIYILAIIQRNIPKAKLEMLYVGTSLFIPLTLTMAYFGINYHTDKCSELERTIGYSNVTILSSAAAVLFATCVISLWILLVVGRRAFGGINPSQIERQHKKAIYEMLPLFTYPHIFLIHIFGVLSVWAYIKVSHVNVLNVPINGALTALESSWGLVASLSFIAHLTVVFCVRRFCVKMSIARHTPQYGAVIL